MGIDAVLVAQSGVISRSQLRELCRDDAHLRRILRRLKPVARGVYARKGDPSPLLAHRGALLVLPGLVFRGRTALLIHDVDATTAPARLEVYVDQRADASDRPQLDVRRTDLAALEREDRHGLPVSSRIRACLDLAATLDRQDALAVVDAVLRDGVSHVDLLAGIRPGSRGAMTVRAVAVLGDPRAESPPESRVRLILRDAGLPVPSLQHVVLSEHGVFIARVDLAWPELRFDLEYDGVATHSTALAMSRDREKHNALLAAGWVGLRVVAGDLRFPALLASRVRDELVRLGHPQLASR